MPNRLIERTNHSESLYDAAFGDIIRDATIIADIGAGDSDFNQGYEARGKTVIRVDPQYAERPPEGNNWYPGVAENLPLAAESVDVAISAFMMQHLESGGIKKAIEEMVRITKTTDNPGRDPHGSVAIFPVFKPGRLKKLIQQQGFGNFAAVGYPDADKIWERHKSLAFETLQIIKTPALSPVILASLAEMIESSNALKPRTTPRKLGRKTLMHLRGDTRFDTSSY